MFYFLALREEESKGDQLVYSDKTWPGERMR